MDKNEVLDIIQNHLSRYLNCTKDDLLKDEIFFVNNDKRDYPFLEICAIGQTVIVSASGALLPKVQTLLKNKNRDEIFECPLIYGQSIYYIPDFKILKKLSLNDSFKYKMLQGDKIQKLRGITGFENSLAFDEFGNTSTCIVFYAMKGSQIIALAGASKEEDKMWELGVDVKPEFRKIGLASALISNLALVILEHPLLGKHV